jgi:hypothetical protein
MLILDHCRLAVMAVIALMALMWVVAFIYSPDNKLDEAHPPLIYGPDLLWTTIFTTWNKYSGYLCTVFPIMVF